VLRINFTNSGEITGEEDPFMYDDIVDDDGYVYLVEEPAVERNPDQDSKAGAEARELILAYQTIAALEENKQGARVDMLVQATKVLTTCLSADEHALCKQGEMPDELGNKVNDAVLKAMEGKDNGNRQFGLTGKNAGIVASVVGQLPYHAQEQGNPEMASQLRTCLGLLRP
jgi:hypothetical protein